MRENGKFALHVACDKITYGAMNTAFLFCKKLSRILKGWNVIMSLCDPYVWKKDADQRQIKIIFYIDNFLMTHVHSQLLTEHIKFLDGHYDAKDILAVTIVKL